MRIPSNTRLHTYPDGGVGVGLPLQFLHEFDMFVCVLKPFQVLQFVAFVWASFQRCHVRCNFILLFIPDQALLSLFTVVVSGGWSRGAASPDLLSCAPPSSPKPPSEFPQTEHRDTSHAKTQVAQTTPKHKFANTTFPRATLANITFANTTCF